MMSHGARWRPLLGFRGQRSGCSDAPARTWAGRSAVRRLGSVCASSSFARRSRPPVPRWTLPASLAIALALVGTALGLEAAGRSARVAGQARRASDRDGGRLEVHLVADSAAVYRVWRNAGVRGRTLVHVGRFLHFVPAQEEDPTTGACRGVTTADAEAKLDNRNFLWVAGYAGIVRRIFYVVPPERFRKPPGTWDRIDVSGFERRVSSRLPEPREPVLLDVHASYFEATDGGTLLDQLRASGLATDLVTLNLAMDGSDVSERSRERLRAFARALAARDVALEPAR